MRCKAKAGYWFRHSFPRRGVWRFGAEEAGFGRNLISQPHSDLSVNSVKETLHRMGILELVLKQKHDESMMNPKQCRASSVLLHRSISPGPSSSVRSIAVSRETVLVISGDSGFLESFHQEVGTEVGINMAFGWKEHQEKLPGGGWRRKAPSKIEGGQVCGSSSLRLPFDHSETRLSTKPFASKHIHGM